MARFVSSLAILALIGAASAARAAEPGACPRPVAAPAPWSAWRADAPAIDAGRELNAMPGLPLGAAITLRLAPVADVKLASAPKEASGNAGLASLTLDQPSRIGIALSGPAWVEVIAGGAVQASTGHGHGPACTGLAKFVWFDLPAGTHVVQLTGASSATLTVLAVAAAD